MYFFRKKGKQYLDLTGNLILSYNDQLVKARSASVGPKKVLNAQFILNTGKLTFWGRIRATRVAMRFIWGKSAPLLEVDTNLNKPIVINKKTTPCITSTVELNGSK